MADECEIYTSEDYVEQRCTDETIRKFDQLKLSPKLVSEIDWDIPQKHISMISPMSVGANPFIDLPEYSLYKLDALNVFDLPTDSPWVSVPISETQFNNFSSQSPESDYIGTLVLKNMDADVTVIYRRIEIHNHTPDEDLSHYIIYTGSTYTNSITVDQVGFHQVADTCICEHLVENGYKTQIVGEFI